MPGGATLNHPRRSRGRRRGAPRFVHGVTAAEHPRGAGQGRPIGGLLRRLLRLHQWRPNLYSGRVCPLCHTLRRCRCRRGGRLRPSGGREGDAREESAPESVQLQRPGRANEELHPPGAWLGHGATSYDGLPGHGDAVGDLRHLHEGHRGREGEGQGRQEQGQGLHRRRAREEAQEGRERADLFGEHETVHQDHGAHGQPERRKRGVLGFQVLGGQERRVPRRGGHVAAVVALLIGEGEA
mmetsp:Transcript_41261/g.119493  ORF Transcript_41261/g.119493 Transcript_41261/m.119493 type:complete len:240 (-) Transcript_41261:410-1129(-)